MSTSDHVGLDTQEGMIELDNSGKLNNCYIDNFLQGIGSDLLKDLGDSFLYDQDGVYGDWNLSVWRKTL